MIGILLVTHGNFADGLKNAVELIAGRQEAFKTIGLYHGDGIEVFQNKILDAVNELDIGKGVLVFVDILGGSPANAVLNLLKNNNFKAIAGVNMPMVCHAVLKRNSDIDVTELFRQCISSGKEALIGLNELFENMHKDVENDF